MAHIFISYSKKNRDYAYQLADYLEANGFPIWIDRADIEYGVNWWNAIVEGLENCAAFVVIMTPESKASDWVQREVFLALDKRKATFPILLNGDNWELFVLTQYADLRTGNMPDDDFLNRLRQRVTPRVKPGTPASTIAPLPVAPPVSSEAAFDVDQAISAFMSAYRKREWSEALNLLGRVRASGEDPHPFDPDEYEARVQNSIEAEKRQREHEERERDCRIRYGRVQIIAAVGDNPATWAALQRFWETCPDYDPDRIAEQVRPKPSSPRSLNLLRQGLPTFDWIAIPGKGYSIGKYPVTNIQFAVFMAAGGYQHRKWWTNAGWKQCEHEKWIQPRFWTNAKWNELRQPVVGVSWYEAVAYCQWLSEETAEHIVLPTEDQWQYAAQGDEGRLYPWGNSWDCQRCSNSVKPCTNRHTTPVRQYEGKGDSPFGVVDMAGNVWEWCLTDYNDRTNDARKLSSRRVLRGGSWEDINSSSFHCALRGNNDPAYWHVNVGFRLALS